MPGTRRSTLDIFLLPAIISLVMIVGLISGLLGDGVWDALSWIALAIPLMAIAMFSVKGRFKD